MRQPLNTHPGIRLDLDVFLANSGFVDETVVLGDNPTALEPIELFNLSQESDGTKSQYIEDQDPFQLYNTVHTTNTRQQRLNLILVGI